MPSKPCDFKERNVRRALRAADKEGLLVRGYEISPSGLIRVLTAPPDHPPDTATEPAPDHLGSPVA